MPPKKAQNGKPYGKIDKPATGEILTDLAKKQWRVGKAIGSGGFGEIYLASDEITKPVTDKASYVVKIEPHENGPLFVEVAFYIRAGKLEMIEEWKRKHKQESFGMPHFVGNGTHEYQGMKCRFLVIPRFGQDLHKVLCEKPGKVFNHKTVFAIALQVLDIYQYIHSKEYVHADVKASNLALEYNTNPKKKQQQLYLLDYGLATKYVDGNGKHIPYSEDCRKAHNGTAEYASRDAHIGAFSRRGDLEVLGYNMLEWLCGSLPWSREDALDKVHRQKQNFMSNISLKKFYPLEIQGLEIVEKFLKYVSKIEFEAEPNYNHCRDLLKKGLPASHKGALFLDEIVSLPSPSKKSSSNKRRSPDIVDAVENKKLCVPFPADTEEQSPKRSTRTTKQVNDFNWARVLSTDPEKLARAAASPSQQTGGIKELNGKSPSPPIVGNPTPAMLQILSKKKENLRSPIKPKSVPPLQPEVLYGSEELTPAMKEVLLRKKKAAVVPKTNAGTGASCRPRRKP